MEHDNLKKDSDITAFDELTDEQLEAVLGGFVKGGKTYTTTFKASNLTFQGLFSGSAQFGISTTAAILPHAASGSSWVGVDSSGNSIYTADAFKKQ